MFYTSLVTDPWDLLDEGLDKSLDVIQGELGVSAVTVRATGPRMARLRTRPIEPRCFRTDGGLYFRPDAAHYYASRCAPPVADWVKSGNPLAHIAAACEQRNLDCRAVLSCSQVGRVSDRQAASACKNAYSLPSRESLCLLNPDVQAWLHGMLADLSTNYRLQTIVLRDLESTWRDSYAVQVTRVDALESQLRQLLSVCVCESCQQGALKAGIDAAVARRAICEHVDDVLQGTAAVKVDGGGVPRWSSTLLDYLAWRDDTLRDLLVDLADASSCDVRLSVNQGDDPMVDHVETQADGLTGVTTPETFEAPADRADTVQPGRIDRREVAVDLTPDRLLDGSPFVQRLLALAEQGYRGAQVHDFGAIPPAGESVVRQAIRIARRTPVG